MKKILITLLLLPVITVAQVDSINTYAGNGTLSCSGDGGLATSAGVRRPTGLGFDLAGNLLIAHDSLIRKVDKSTGIISTVAGSLTAITLGNGGPATSARVYGSNAVPIDKTGNFYIDEGKNIRKITVLTGIIDNYAGTGATGGTGDDGPATAATFNVIKCICIDTVFGYLYISDEWDYRVRKINLATGIISACAGTGISGYSGDGGLATAAQLSTTQGVGTDKYGNLYIGDENNHRIRKVDAATGIITTIAGTGGYGSGGDGGAATSATLAQPTSIVIDSCNNIYFSDEINDKVRRIDGITGIITTVAGIGSVGYWGDGGPAWSAKFYFTEGIVADNAGGLYIADIQNDRVRKVTLVPTGGIPSITTASTIICTGSATFNASVSGGIGVGYQWYVNGAPVGGATGSTYTYPPANGDSIRCVVVSGGHCNGTVTGSSNSLNMVVMPVYTPTISIASVSAASFGSTVTVNAVVAGAGSSYNIKWMNKGVIFATTSVPTVTYTKLAGIDSITAKVISTSAGCYDSTISALHTVAQTNVGFANVVMPDVSVIPNPARDEILVNACSKIEGVEVSNMLGQTLISKQCHTNTEHITILELPCGIYVVSVAAEDGQKIAVKLIKE